MKKILLAAALVTAITATAQTKHIFNDPPEQKAQRMQWWTNARFGMFIHWGLYSLAARHEWVKQHERMTSEQYQKYFDHFNPDEFDPKKWAKEAKAAGMKYAVLTTKHHEGFCLFDSKYTDYKATNTQAKRDLVKEFVEAFRAEGIRIGFYYSLIDWHHPDFTIDRVHPQRLGENATGADYAKLNKGKNWERYRQYLYNQVKELMTNYGKIDILWLDFSYPGKNGKGREDWGSIELLKMVKQLQPGIIIDNRADLNDYTDGYDFETPEQVKPSELLKYKGKYWETCQTFSGSWGYYRDEHTWKTHRQLLDLLVTSVANGGNLILNVGPTARGEFDYRALHALDSLSYWMHANNPSIYNCTFAPDEYKLPGNPDIKQTYDPVKKHLYLHLFTYPIDGKLVLPGYADKISYAQFLNDASELLYKKEDSNIVLQLPAQPPPYEVPVIELFLR
ncbi:alpha-L-fucosidase [Niabella ginsenosidivorans]|uniref:alpha-L-fucosidase n=1 Tax=Niabella ginsenosidivorans TaxID=1176587 RepID=A0A1A9I2H6_9BACT|nr:alpha-L-fucosidase [Niabella ginsenosidivorans]ANH81733.1 alpha-L-fucosidase [Niabella ginsenosidivorans]